MTWKELFNIVDDVTSMNNGCGLIPAYDHLSLAAVLLFALGVIEVDGKKMTKEKCEEIKRKIKSFR